ncbi:MAG: gamma-glutamyl-phosphate reductase, partial [Alphaproteobacteria bacterium]
MSAVKSIESNALEAQMAVLGANARAAARVLAGTPTAAKQAAIEAAADAIAAARNDIIQANVEDMAAARAARLNDAMLDRLVLDTARIDAMVTGMRKVAALD